MEERLKNITNRLKEFWNRFTNKQRVTFISILGVVVVALSVLGYALSRPTMVTLVTSESTKQTSEVVELLDSEGIKNTTSDDGYVVYVNKNDLSNATVLLGANSIPADGYSIETALGGGFSTTEADKEKKYRLYLEEYIATLLESMDVVKDASVKLTIPDDDGTIISQKQDAYASVILTLSGTLEENTAATMARFIATGVGNKTTDNIVIVDSIGNLLFSGEDNTSALGSASNQFTVKSQAESLVKNQVKNVILGTSVYDAVEVAPNLQLNFDKINETEHTHSPAEGQEQGLLSHEKGYTQDVVGGTSGVPGTDTNNNNTYVIEDNEYSSSNTEEFSKDYVTNQVVRDTQYATGSVNYEE